jgi:hypothetical protein
MTAQQCGAGNNLDVVARAANVAIGAGGFLTLGGMNSSATHKPDGCFVWLGPAAQRKPQRQPCWSYFRRGGSGQSGCGTRHVGGPIVRHNALLSTAAAVLVTYSSTWVIADLIALNALCGVQADGLPVGGFRSEGK